MNEQEYTYCGSKVSKEIFDKLVGLAELHDYVADDRFSLSLRDHDFDSEIFYKADTFEEYIDLYNKKNPEDTITAETHDFGEWSFIWLKRVDAGLDAISEYQGQLLKSVS